MSKPRTVETKKEGFRFVWKTNKEDRRGINVDVYQGDKCVVQWAYRKVVGPSVLGNAMFWQDQILLQVKAELAKEVSIAPSTLAPAVSL